MGPDSGKRKVDGRCARTSPGQAKNVDMESENEYEAQRLARIRDNQAVMAAMGLAQLAASLAEARTGTARRRPATRPARRSVRVACIRRSPRINTALAARTAECTPAHSKHDLAKYVGLVTRLVMGAARLVACEDIAYMPKSMVESLASRQGFVRTEDAANVRAVVCRRVHQELCASSAVRMVAPDQVPRKAIVAVRRLLNAPSKALSEDYYRIHAGP